MISPTLPTTRDYVQNHLNPMTVTQRVTAASIKLGGIKPPQESVLNGYVSVLDFSSVTENEIFLTGIVSESFQSGSSLKVSILWVPKDTLTGLVGWEIESSFTPVGASFGVSVSSTLHQDTLANLTLHKTAKAFLVGGLAGDAIAVRLYRNIDIDTYPNDARFFGVEFEMTVDRLGK